MQQMFKGVEFSPPTITTAAINEVDTRIFVDDVSVFGSEFPNLATLRTGDYGEIVKIIAAGTNFIDVQRGYSGSAEQWPSGTIIARYFTAEDQNALQENVLELTNSQNTANGKISVLETDTSTLQTNLADLSQSHAALSGTVTDVQQDVENLESAMSTAQQDISSLETSMNTAQQDITGLGQSYSTLASEVSDVKQGVTDLETVMSEAQSDIESNQQAAETAQTAAETAKESAAKKIIGGYEISIASSAWTASGNTWVATITDARIPAETTEYRISPHINWNEEALANLILLSGWILAETPPEGGLYTVTLGYTTEEAPEKPEFAMMGDLIIMEVKRI